MAKTETETKTPETPVNHLMHIYVHRPHGEREDAMYVGHNGKAYLVQYDKDVYVPEPVYYLIKEHLRAEKVRDDHIDRLNS